MRGAGSPGAWALAATLAVGAAHAQVIELDDEPPARKAPAKKPAAKAAPSAPAPKKKPKGEALPEGPRRGIPAVREGYGPASSAPATAKSPAAAPTAAMPTVPPAAGDETEVFDSDTGDTSANAPARAPASSSQPEDERFELTGWVRTRASLYGEDDQRAPADPLLVAVTREAEGQTLPYDRATGDVQAYLRARYRKGKRFEAVVAASAAWSARASSRKSPRPRRKAIAARMQNTSMERRSCARSIAGSASSWIASNARRSSTRWSPWAARSPSATG